MLDTPHTRRAFIRRLTLAGAAVALSGGAGLGLAGGSPSWRRVNVRAYGAVGDGVVDDTRAVAAAVASMRTRTVLHFPPGRYRIARRWPAGGAAILLVGLSHVGVEMAPGAELLMDNLDDNGNGTGHAIAIVGPAVDVRVRGCTIRWAPEAARRGFGDAIRVLGFPSDDAPPRGWRGSGGSVRDLVIEDCTIQGAPQTGVILMGCAGARLTRLVVRESRADGVHVNACRDVRVRGLRVYGPGDDGLAWVTYQHPTAPWLGSEGPFARRSLGRWSNSGSHATDVEVHDGGANGVRISGAQGLTVDRIRARGVAAGVIVDAGRLGHANAWQYLASRGCAVRGVDVADADVGALVQVFGASDADDPAWWRFDVDLRGVRTVDCRRYGIRVEGAYRPGSVVAGIRVVGVRVRGTSGVGASFTGLRDSEIDNVYVVGGSIAFHGTAAPPTGPMRLLPEHHLRLGVLSASGGAVAMEDVAWATVEEIRVAGAPLTAVDLTRVRDLDIRRIRVAGAGLEAGLARGLLICKGQRVRVRDAEITVGTPAAGPWRALEIGGGDPIDRSHDVAVQRMRYRRTDTPASDALVQEGRFAPRRWIYRVEFGRAGTRRVEARGDVLTVRERMSKRPPAGAACPRSVRPPRSAPENAGCPG